MLININPYSFVEQDFIWIGEYFDGTHLSEYDIQTHKSSDFYSLQRDKLLRFGLIGRGMKLYYEVGGGFFKLNGQLYELIYEVEGKEYYLTGQMTPYNDVIQFKDAEAWAGTNARGETTFPSRIMAYNFGYKKKLDIDGVKFNIKAMVSVPYNAPVHFNVQLVADRKMEGKLIVKKNGAVAGEFDAPLDKGVGGKLTWAVR